MKVEERPIDSIIPYENNPREHSEEQVNRIANSIAEFGFNQPIVVDENNIILVGHGRLEAAKKLGHKTAPVVKKEKLTEAQKKAYRIIDNKLQNDSTWALELLDIELDSLEELGFDLESYGLDDLLDDKEIEIEEEPLVECENKETLIKLGDVIEIGPHKVVCGDSTDEAIARKLLNGRTPALMVTDPPYGVNYDPEWRADYDGNLGTRATGRVSNDDIFSWGGLIKTSMLQCCIFGTLRDMPKIQHWS